MGQATWLVRMEAALRSVWDKRWWFSALSPIFLLSQFFVITIFFNSLLQTTCLGCHVLVLVVIRKGLSRVRDGLLVTEMDLNIIQQIKDKWCFQVRREGTLEHENNFTGPFRSGPSLTCLFLFYNSVLADTADLTQKPHLYGNFLVGKHVQFDPLSGLVLPTCMAC